MIFPALRSLLLVVAVLGPNAALAAGSADDVWRYPAQDRIVVFGDVHGDHDALLALLRSASVIDEEGAWIAGETHLVSLGDLLDRGPDSRKAMDLLIRLQGEAVAAGGQVHVIVGNHELMNLAGDLRYVDPGEYAAFAGTEDDALRVQALADARELGLDEELVHARPPGFFAHRAAFLPDGYYGSWILAQRALVVLGDRLFLHGGASPVLLEGNRERIEARIRASLEEAAAVRREAAFRRPDRLDLSVLSPAPPEGVDAELRERLSALAGDAFLGPDGPFWYRGNATCHPLLEAPALTRTLDGLGVSSVAVGHTPQRDGRIHSRLDARVLLLDTGMADYYGGRPRALVVENGVERVVSPDGDQAEAEALWPDVDAGLDPVTLQRVLNEGRVEVLDEARVRLVSGGHVLEARMLRARGRARSNALAARRLDELLGLGMVPALVEREVQGRTRLLEVDAGEWLAEAGRVERRIPPPATCYAGHPFDLVRLFDALLGNARSAAGLSWSLPSLTIRLTEHGDAFPRSDRVPELPPSEAPLAHLLARVDAARLREALGEFLDKRRLAALIARRDALLSALEES